MKYENHVQKRARPVQQILVTAILIALWSHVTMDNYHKLMFASLVQIF